MIQELYPLIVVAHILGGFIFAMAHGVSLFVAFRIRGQHDPDRIRAYLELSAGTVPMMYAGLLILLVAGIGAAIMRGWFGFGWPWLSLGLLVGLALLMYQRGSVYYNHVRRSLGLRTYQDKPDAPLPPPRPTEEVVRLLSTRRPEELAVVGGLGLGVIIWLMVAKPF